MIRACYTLSDANGNITEYCDSQGSTVAHFEYSPFGSITYQSGEMADEFAFRYSTKYYCTELNMYDFGMRWYSPEVARFINRDPIEESGGTLLYAFVRNNPICLWDLRGQSIGCEATGGWGKDPCNCCCGSPRKMYDSYEKCCCLTEMRLYSKVFLKDAKWKGYCVMVDAGDGVGGGGLRCTLKTDVLYNCEQWQINVKAAFVGLTFGSPINATKFAVSFSGASVMDDFSGKAIIQSVGVSVGGGWSLSKIDLGNASTGDISFGVQTGIAASASAYAGKSWVSSKETIKNNKCMFWDDEITDVLAD